MSVRSDQGNSCAAQVRGTAIRVLRIERRTAVLSVGVLMLTAGLVAVLPAAAVGPGFEPIHTTARTAVALTAPAAGDVWVAESAADGSLALEHLSNGVWTDVGAPAASSASARFSATASDDVWLFTDSKVFHYDGTTWSTPALPAAVGVVGDAWVYGSHDGAEPGRFALRTSALADPVLGGDQGEEVVDLASVPGTATVYASPGRERRQSFSSRPT